MGNGQLGVIRLQKVEGGLVSDAGGLHGLACRVGGGELPCPLQLVPLHQDQDFPGVVAAAEHLGVPT